MPDTLEAVEISAGTGTNVAVDEVTQSAVDYQLQVMKLGLGADGALDRYLKNGQEAMADSLPVVIASNQTPVTVQNPASTPTLYNVTLATANTEYSQALPANCRRVFFKCRTSKDIRWAWVTGKVATPTAPYMTLNANSTYSSDDVNIASGTLYLASPSNNVVVEIECWS